MDANTLLQCFSATLQVSQATREQAEAQLRQLSLTPGFLGACLDIIASPSAPVGVRKAAAVYFKNRVVRSWNSPAQPIDEGEKPVVKDRIVAVLSAVDHTTKQQLIPVLRVLVSFEYPAQWPGLLQQTGELLQQQDGPSSMYTGVLCFAEICRSYRWVMNLERESEMDPIIAQVFPHLLSVGNAILAAEITEVTAEILKLILKTYKFVTYYDLPKVLQTKESLVAWGQFHCLVIQLDPPAYVLSPSLSELERCQTQISKCYKWAVANMERLFRRYASKDLSSKMKYDAFRGVFIDEFVPHLMSVYLSLVESWCGGRRWLSTTALYHLLEFMSHSVTQKESWALIQPYFENLVAHFIYPLLCPSSETLELFETDPNDYINLKLDNFDDSEADVAALGLLVTFVTKRKKTTLEPIVTFAYNQLSSLKKVPEDLDVAKKKDGALRLIGGVSHLLTSPKSPYASQMESFLAELVLPNLNSQFEFLQARTLDVCSKFADLPFENSQTLSTLFHGILKSFTSEGSDASLPVMLQSALGIQAFIHNSQFKQILSSIILPTMSKLLELSNEIDNDAVSMVMQECVENFSEQLQPFGVELMNNLVQQFMRVAVEVNDAANVGVEEIESDYVDLSDKIMAAVGLLNTMITVLLSFENSKEICMKLEETFSPVIDYVFTNELDDFLAEVAELIENSIFLLRAVSPLMWRHFAQLSNSFFEGIAVMYIEELSQCLKNYMVFGAEDLAHNQENVSKMMQMIGFILEADDGNADYNDMVTACDLAQTLVLSLQNNASLVIQPLSKNILPVFASNRKDSLHVSTNALTVALTNFVVSCLVYDPALTLGLLLLYTKEFFEQWFALIPLLKRVYDIKLSILGLISLVNNPDVLQAVQSIAGSIASRLAVLFKELPSAIKNFEKQRVEFNESDYTDVGNFNDYDDETESVGSGAENEDDSTSEYLEFLKQENHKLTGAAFTAEEEPVFEDPLATTPLDSINTFQVFKDFSNSLQVNNAAVYHAIFDNVSEEERKVFMGVLEMVPKTH